MASCKRCGNVFHGISDLAGTDPKSRSEYCSKRCEAISNGAWEGYCPLSEDGNHVLHPSRGYTQSADGGSFDVQCKTCTLEGTSEPFNTAVFEFRSDSDGFETVNTL